MPIAPERPSVAQPSNPKHVADRFSDIEIANSAFFGGFRGNGQVTAVAVALAESGGDAAAIGDRTLQNGTWGVSVGLWQIRTLKAEYRTGRTRDYAALIGDDAFQARSAYKISSGGKSWRPWSTYQNGAYKKFLTRARAACNGTVPLTGRTHGENDPTGGSSGTSATTSGPVFAPDLPDVAAIPLRVSGQRLAGELGALFTGGTLDLSMDESSMLTFSLVDDGYRLPDTWWLEVGSIVDYSGIRWIVADVSIAHQGVTPISTFRCLPYGVKAMKRTTTGARGRATPTWFMSLIAKGAGLAFFGEPTNMIDNGAIAPAPKERGYGNDPLKVLAPSIVQEQLPATETAWELGQRLADQLGFALFEAGGTLYFASPEYLFQRKPKLWVSVDGSTGPGYVIPVTRPQVKVNATTWTTKRVKGRMVRTPYASDVTYTVDLPREVLGRLQVGQGLGFAGMGAYGTDRARFTVISGIRVDLGDPAAPVTVTTKTNTLFMRSAAVGDPVGLAAAPTTDQSAFTKTSKTSRRAIDMVTVALKQDGDRYVWGAEASKKDPDPDAFDCSELVEWACARVGGYMPDGSANQRAYCRSHGTAISVAKALRTRGALMFMGNPVHHVAISLGDGQHTIEARGRAYGVGQFSSTRGFTSAGLVPSLRY